MDEVNSSVHVLSFLAFIYDVDVVRVLKADEMGLVWPAGCSTL
jgi:hypothetical protein